MPSFIEVVMFAPNIPTLVMMTRRRQPCRHLCVFSIKTTNFHANKTPPPSPLSAVREPTARYHHPCPDGNPPSDEETKSTAGDKHETGRAMMQLEQEKLSVQMAEVQQLQQVLDRIQLEDLPPGIGEGNVVLTSQGNYFLAISAGKVELEGKLFYLISLASPIGVALMGKKAWEVVSFRGQEFRILEVQ
jgi:hypothetical protein